MKTKDIPFEITPQILRYLQTILDFEDKFLGQLTGDCLLIDTYSQEENVNLKSELNYVAFWSHLNKIKAIEYLTRKLRHGETLNDWKLVKSNFIEGQRATIGYPKKQKVRILDANKLKELYKKINPSITTESNENGNIATTESKLLNKYEVGVKDREIWINNKYLISKPHSIGSNMEFFLYLLENQNVKIKKIDLSENIKNEIKSKRITKIINALGFTGEILKAFFPKRGKGGLLFRQTVSREELQEMGIKEDLFLKELELSHMKKYSPK